VLEEEALRDYIYIWLVDQRHGGKLRDLLQLLTVSAPSTRRLPSQPKFPLPTLHLSGSCASVIELPAMTARRAGRKSNHPRSQATILFIYFVNPIYHAKMVIYVTRLIRCFDLWSHQKCSCYCPKSCWDSGICLLTVVC